MQNCLKQHDEGSSMLFEAARLTKQHAQVFEAARCQRSSTLNEAARLTKQHAMLFEAAR